MISSAPARWGAWIAGSPRWLLVRRMPAASVPLTIAVALCVVLTSSLPTGFTLVAGALVGALPEAIDQGLGSAAGDRTMVALGALGLIFAAQQILAPLQATVADALGRRLMAVNARQIMQATLGPAGVAHLEESGYVDQVFRALPEQSVGPRAAVSALVGDTTSRLTAVAGLALVAYFQWWLAILLLVTLIHKVHRYGPIRRQLVTVRMGKAPELRRANYFLDLTLRPEAAKEIRIFGLAEWFVERYRGAWLGAMAELWTSRSSLSTAVPWAALPVIAVELLGLALIGQDAVNGSIDLGALVVYVRALVASERIAAIGDADSRLDHGTAGLRPTLALERALAGDSSINPAGTRPADGLPERDIRFEGVKFRYPGQAADVFSGLDLTVPAGRSLAIVGDNGAGKTTLVKLLARLYAPTAGRITVDGTDLAAYSASSWQRRVAAIFQDFVRYELSAADNIAFGAVERGGDRAALVEAAGRAGALDVIERLPRGWGTVLSRRYTEGVDLSGGEWQRIALARALFAAAAGAGILILDEPTAQLDVRAEAAFYDQFLELTHGLTTIVISHRFSTVRRADRIVVLSDGRIVESGTHDELVSMGGRYAEMFRLQAARFAEEARHGADLDSGRRE